MLGRLARWLRLLGFDTLYYPYLEDSLLLRAAREDQRIILTRDTRIVKVRDVGRHLLLRENDSFEQLQEVIHEFSLGHYIHNLLLGTDPVSRCSLCNGTLDEISCEDAKGSVPDYVLTTAGGFKRCRDCGKHYWRGTHRERLLAKLREISSPPTNSTRF